MDKLDVLYTINNNYLDICLGSIISLIKKSNIGKLRIHIITSDFTIDDYRKAERILSNYCCEYYFYTMESIDINRFAIPDWRGNQIANARLFFQDIMGSRIDSIQNLLYLDSDLIVVDDLSNLSMYVDSAVNAVRDGCSKTYLKNLGLDAYFNSGVILFKPDLWSKHNCQDRIIHFIENNESELTYPDQDILNCALHDLISEIPLNYNLSAMAYLFNLFMQKLYYNDDMNISSDMLEEAKREPKILHSTGILSIKPWTNNKINPLNELFMQYILEANPDFQKVELSKLKKVLSSYPTLFKLIILIKNYMPEKMKLLSRKLVN